MLFHAIKNTYNWNPSEVVHSTWDFFLFLAQQEATNFIMSIDIFQRAGLKEKGPENFILWTSPK